jgi:vacuolar-type H+-ATPase subunit I/STV1
LSQHISNTTKIKVYELCKNDESLFKEFFEEIEKDGNLLDNLAGAIRIVEDTSNLSRRPKSKFREIKGHNLKCKVYEAKSGIIRIYLFHEEKTGRVVVSGGLKDNQNVDLRSVIKTIKEYQDEK